MAATPSRERCACGFMPASQQHVCAVPPPRKWVKDAAQAAATETAKKPVHLMTESEAVAAGYAKPEGGLTEAGHKAFEEYEQLRKAEESAFREKLSNLSKDDLNALGSALEAKRHGIRAMLEVIDGQLSAIHHQVRAVEDSDPLGKTGESPTAQTDTSIGKTIA